MFSIGLQNKYLSTSRRPLVSNINFNYTVPELVGSNKILRYVLSGWQTGALLTYASGTPILVPTSQNQLTNQRPRHIVHESGPGVPLYLQDLNCHCFDPTKTLVLNPAAWADSGSRHVRNLHGVLQRLSVSTASRRRTSTSDATFRIRER